MVKICHILLKRSFSICIPVSRIPQEVIKNIQEFCWNNFYVACANFPFKIHESGWGEFEMMIRIYFKEDVREPIDIFHNLKVLLGYIEILTIMVNSFIILIQMLLIQAKSPLFLNFTMKLFS